MSTTLAAPSPVVKPSRHYELLMTAKNRDFPAEAGVYVIFDGMGESIAYVGMTINMQHRIAGHKRLPWTPRAFIRFMPIPDPIARAATERFLIRYYHPFLNRIERGQPRFIDHHRPEMNGRTWGKWTYCVFDGLLELVVNHEHLYGIYIRNFTPENIDFEARNLAGMGMGEHIETLWAAAYAITPESLRGFNG